ncbi:tyrosine-protein phosphatase [[Clostridium] dakarense]|uniref:tyrosine-protein phosphatase n=1 Tax=Faecalimicrobium dakarense TaxID=1301100 RepID=UPI0004AE610B|nr:tyrosine-protein phosphatase [[Clostridium] dakarense]
MKNFRDLGGYKTKDGRIVKKGLFFRSANLNNLNEEDIDTLKNLNIKYIFDYRSDEEADKLPSTVIKNIQNIRVSAMKFENEKNAKFGSIEEMMKEMIKSNGVFDMLKKSYYDLPIDNTSYKRLVELIKNTQNLPILNHCTAGKDRTGVGCAIIYMILGVSRDDIIEEYLKSNKYSKESIEEYIIKNQDLKSVPLENLNNIFGVNEEYIKEAFKRIDENYDTVENYLYNEFNLTKEDIDSIRNHCLY